jgi:hypothetical protein
MSPSALIPHLGMALEKAFCTFRMYLLKAIRSSIEKQRAKLQSLAPQEPS